MKALSWGKLLGAARTHGRRFAQCFQAILPVLSTRIGIDIMKSNSNRDPKRKRNRFAAGLSNLYHMQGQTPRAPAGPVRPVTVSPGQQLRIPPRPYHTGGVLSSQEGVRFFARRPGDAIRFLPPDTEANREFIGSLQNIPRSGTFFTDRNGVPMQFVGEGQFGWDLSSSGDFTATGRVTVDRPSAIAPPPHPQVHVISTPREVPGLVSRDIEQRVIAAMARNVDRQMMEGLQAGSYIAAADLRSSIINTDRVAGGGINAMDIRNISVDRNHSGLISFGQAAEINRRSLQDELDRSSFRATNLIIRDSSGNVVFSGEGPVTISERKEPITQPIHPEAGKVLTRPMRTVFGRAVEEVRNEDGTVSMRPRPATSK